MPFEKCPICNGEIVEKTIEKIIHGGKHTAIITINAEVCLHCGEILFSDGDIRRFEEIKKKLERNEVQSFRQLGQSFQVV